MIFFPLGILLKSVFFKKLVLGLYRDGTLKDVYEN